MTTVSTIAYMNEEQQRGQQVAAFLGVQDDLLRDLTGLAEGVKDEDAIEEGDHPLISAAMESIVRRHNSALRLLPDSTSTGELVMESINDKGGSASSGWLKRIWDIFVRIIKSIAKALKSVWTWLTNLIAKSKARRDYLARKLTNLSKTLTKKQDKRGVAFTANVTVGEEQLKYFSVNNVIAADQVKVITDLAFTMREYRMSQGLKRAIGVILTIDAQSTNKRFGDKNVVFTDLFGKVTAEDLEVINKTHWIKPEGYLKYQGGTEAPNTLTNIVKSIVGNKVIVRHTPINYGELISNSGYELLPASNQGGNADNLIRFNEPKDIQELISINLQLLEELENTSRSMREVENVVKTVFQLEKLAMDIKINDQSPEGAENVIQGLRILNAMTKSLTNFPAAMFSHGVVIASAQVSLIEHAIKISSLG